MLAARRHGIGPLGAAAGAADLDLRPGRRLSVHGNGAEPGLALGGPDYQRHNRRQLLDLQRLYRRRDRAGGSAKAFGFIGAAWSLGFLFGPALGGALAEIDLRLPFFVCAGLALANWLYGLLVLPESLPPEKRQPRFDWKRANPLGSLKLLRSHPDLSALASIGFLFQLAHTVLPSIFVLYVGFRYGWSPGTMGLAMMLTGLSNILVQTLLVGRIVGKIGERGALLFGLAAFGLGFLIYGLAPTGLIYLVGAPVFAFSALIQPGLQGLMTRRVGPSEQGQLQGANSSIVGIVALIGPSLFGLSFAYAVRHDATLHMPGLPIFLAAGLSVLAILLTLVAVPKPIAEPENLAR